MCAIRNYEDYLNYVYNSQKDIELNQPEEIEDHKEVKHAKQS